MQRGAPGLKEPCQQRHQVVFADRRQTLSCFNIGTAVKKIDPQSNLEKYLGHEGQISFE